MEYCEPRFSNSSGCRKLEQTRVNPDGTSIRVHYQYNTHNRSVTDIKITTSVPNPVVPRPSFTLPSGTPDLLGKRISPEGNN